MTKLNCSFPWINSYKGTLKPCNSNDHIRDLIKLSHGLYDQKTIEDIKKFGCKIEKCDQTTWTLISQERQDFDPPPLPFNISILNLVFPSSTKVKMFVMLRHLL